MADIDPLARMDWLKAEVKRVRMDDQERRWRDRLASEIATLTRLVAAVAIVVLAGGLYAISASGGGVGP